MKHEDILLLECLEEIHMKINQSLKKLGQLRSIHVNQLEYWSEELSSSRRLLEELSLPARLIVEQLILHQQKTSMVALESELISQPFSSVSRIKVEAFGIIKTKLGDLEVTWRDGNNSYYLYPDKVELRAVDERSSVKLFFSLPFAKQALEKMPELLESPHIAYIHPQLEQWLRKV